MGPKTEPGEPWKNRTTFDADRAERYICRTGLFSELEVDKVAAGEIGPELYEKIARDVMTMNIQLKITFYQ